MRSNSHLRRLGAVSRGFGISLLVLIGQLLQYCQLNALTILMWRLVAKLQRIPNPQVCFYLGIAYASAGQLEAAVKSIGQAAALDSREGWYDFELGVLLERKGQDQEALAAYERCMTKADEFSPAFKTELSTRIDRLRAMTKTS